jgi:hypothetical protein
VGIVALFYFLAGASLLSGAGPSVPPPWGMGLTFGVGQSALAVVLYLNLERSSGLSPAAGRDGGFDG